MEVNEYRRTGHKILAQVTQECKQKVTLYTWNVQRAKSKEFVEQTLTRLEIGEQKINKDVIRMTRQLTKDFRFRAKLRASPVEAFTVFF